jgi:hypothetical protein
MKRTAQAGQGGPVVIACIDLASTDLGWPLPTLTAALQAFYDQNFKPVWGYDVRLYATDSPAPTDWLFVYMDNADEANALGYHDLTVKGQPISKVFINDILKSKQAVSVTACHELCEMVIDPLANLWSQAPDGRLWAYEMCDAVEEDVFDVNGVPMSNFVHPAYFEPFNHPTGTKFDHLGKLTAPFSMDSGGYSIVMEHGKVKNIFGSKAKEARFAEENRALHRSEFRRRHKGIKR